MGVLTRHLRPWSPPDKRCSVGRLHRPPPARFFDSAVEPSGHFRGQQETVAPVAGWAVVGQPPPGMPAVGSGVRGCFHVYGYTAAKRGRRPSIIGPPAARPMTHGAGRTGCGADGLYAVVTRPDRSHLGGVAGLLAWSPWLGPIRPVVHALIGVTAFRNNRQCKYQLSCGGLGPSFALPRRSSGTSPRPAVP